MNKKGKDKHLFVLSEAGKPIYTLHGDEDMLVSLFGVMQVRMMQKSLDNLI